MFTKNVGCLMTKLLRGIGLVILTLYFGESAVAQTCAISAATPVKSLGELPADIQALLGVNLPGTRGIADVGARFNSTDVILEELPMRRFKSAKLNEECGVVTVEYGGRGYHVENEMFRFTHDHWVRVASDR